MLNINFIHYKQIQLKKFAEMWMQEHKYSTFFILFIGAPICMLTAVSACTTAIIFPIAWIMGWI